MEPVFHVHWGYFSFSIYFFKNEDFSVKIFHIYYYYFKNE